jgi:hypothetical protein
MEKDKKPTVMRRREMQERQRIVKMLLVQGVRSLDAIEAHLEAVGFSVSRAVLDKDVQLMLENIRNDVAALLPDYRALWVMRVEYLASELLRDFATESSSTARRSLARILMEIFNAVKDVTELNKTGVQLDKNPELKETLNRVLIAFETRGVPANEALEALFQAVAIEAGDERSKTDSAGSDTEDA